jgi:hypothetical protein
MSEKNILLEMQVRQYKHDEGFHKEIARLPTQRRLTHMSLHFTKYAGNILSNSNDEEYVRKIVIDTIIICISVINTLNIRLWEIDGFVEVSNSGSIESFDCRKRVFLSADAFGRSLAIRAGSLAAASEKLDHLESFNYRESFTEGTLDILRDSFCFCKEQSWSPLTETSNRLLQVKKRSSLYGYL